eukprot:13864621-Alexandrium_andersonii.AAC.1
MVTEILGCAELQALSCIHHRAAKDANDCEHSEAVMEIDEAIDVMDPMDHERVQEAKREAQNRKDHKDSFKKEYMQKAAAVRSSLQPTSNKKRNATAQSSSS